MNSLDIPSLLAALADTHPLLVRLALASVELIALIAVTATMVRLLRIRSPRVVYWLWLVVLVKPVFSLAVGSPLPVVLFEKPVAMAEAVVETPAASITPKLCHHMICPGTRRCQLSSPIPVRVAVASMKSALKTKKVMSSRPHTQPPRPNISVPTTTAPAAPLTAKDLRQ